jgi:hypothetical protein
MRIVRVSSEEPPRRHSLTPIGDELTHHEFEVGRPSLRDRWRRRRRLLPAPTQWWGRMLVGLVQFAGALAAAVGLALAIAAVGGWTDRAALAKSSSSSAEC